MDFKDLSRIIIYLGLTITAIGVFCFFFANNLNFLGRLPGDIRIERENFRFYFPLTTMILLSLVLNIIIRLIRFFLH